AAILRPWVRSVGPLLVAAPLIGAVVGAAGLVVSYHTGLAAGPAVAVGLAGLFLVSWLAAGLRPPASAR
ncbi:MAG: metal ABC transporter permease, partial [Actinomycetota bacterium]